MASFAAAAIALGGCRGDRAQGGGDAAPPAASADTDAVPQNAPAAPQGAFTVTGQPVVTREDSIREAIADSTKEARLYHQRQQSMESYGSCMAKARQADAEQRPVLEAACRRSHPAAP